MIIVTLPLTLLFGGPLREEFVWRDRPLPLLRGRWGWRRTSLGLGLVWGVWHLPLLFIDGTSQAHIPRARCLRRAVALSVLFARLVNRAAGNVVTAWVLMALVVFGLMAQGGNRTGPP